MANGPREQLGWVQTLAAAQTEPDDPAFAEPHRPSRHALRDVHGEVARDVGGEPDLDAVQIARFVRTGAVALEDLLPRRPSTHWFGRREDGLDVDAALGRRGSRVVHDHLAEVALALQNSRGGDPDLDELREVRESTSLMQLCLADARQGHLIALGDLAQTRGVHGRFEMDVQFDLRVERGLSYLRALLPPARQTRYEWTKPSSSPSSTLWALPTSWPVRRSLTIWYGCRT